MQLLRRKAAAASTVNNYCGDDELQGTVGLTWTCSFLNFLQKWACCEQFSSMLFRYRHLLIVLKTHRSLSSTVLNTFNYLIVKLSCCCREYPQHFCGSFCTSYESAYKGNHKIRQGHSLPWLTRSLTVGQWFLLSLWYRSTDIFFHEQNFHGILIDNLFPFRYLRFIPLHLYRYIYSDKNLLCFFIWDWIVLTSSLFLILFPLL